MDAVDRSRWRAYPIGLAMVAELVEGVLRPLAGDDRSRLLDRAARTRPFRLRSLSRARSSRRAHWSEARAELARRLQLIGLHPPKRAFEIADPFVRTYFDLLPINESRGAANFRPSTAT